MFHSQARFTSSLYFAFFDTNGGYVTSSGLTFCLGNFQSLLQKLFVRHSLAPTGASVLYHAI